MRFKDRHEAEEYALKFLEFEETPLEHVLSKVEKLELLDFIRDVWTSAIEGHNCLPMDDMDNCR